MRPASETMDGPLDELAQRAGLSPRWTDYRGIARQVAPDVLRSALAALGFAADSPARVRESLAAVQAAAVGTLPALCVGRVGEALPLPPALGLRLAAGSVVRLHLEDGNPLDVRLIGDGRGRSALPALDVAPGYHMLEWGASTLPLALAPARCPAFAELSGQARGYGVAVQLYSLRGRHDTGIGDFSALAETAGVLGRHGAAALAISPVHALFSADVHHFSPYSPSNRLFLNVLHADAQAAGLGAEAAACGLDEAMAAGGELVDWPQVARQRQASLRRLWDYLSASLIAGIDPLGADFQRFVRAGGSALEHHVRFELLHGLQYGSDPARWDWRSWPAELQQPDGVQVQRLAAEHMHEIGFHRFVQWVAARGLAAAQAQASAAGMPIGLIADIAVGTSAGGSYAWSQPQDVLSGLSIGAPPDLLNRFGQKWGLSTYTPQALLRHGYAPFIDLVRAALRHAGGVRIDHVLGLRRLWVAPEGGTGADGVYLDYPLEDLLALLALEAHRHRALVVGEDLGTVPEGMRERLADAGVAGMSVLWFERDYGYFVDPSRWSEHALAMSSTHDLPTVAGWWRGRDLDWRQRVGHLQADSEEFAERAADRKALWGAFEYAGVARGAAPAVDQPAAVVDAALRFVSKAPAALALLPIEDVCGLEEQPNLPGTVDEHPNWRRRLPQPAPALLATPAVRARLDALQAARGSHK